MQAGTTPRWTFRQRCALAAVPPTAALLLRLLARTLRYEVVCEDGAHAPLPDEHGIWCFWHRCLIGSACYFRQRPRTALLISQSFDGELIARTIERLGFLTVRGSSTRGGALGLRTLVRAVNTGASAVFPADGPRGPRYSLKPGALKLAQLTGMPLGFFYLLTQRYWSLHSWDALLIPKPFSRVVLVWGPHMPVSHTDSLETLKTEAEATLERLRARAEAHFRSDR